MDQRARREAMGGLRPGRETRASDGCNQRHEDDDKDHAHGQERLRIDVRQAIAGAYEAGAPEQNENDRSSRDRQLREARWFWRHRGFADGGRRHAYTIFYAAFPCPLFPDEPLSTCRMGAASGLRKNMKLLVFYIVFVAISEAITYAAGRTVELWSPATSLPVFLSGFFFVLWAAWRLAVKVA